MCESPSPLVRIEFRLELTFTPLLANDTTTATEEVLNTVVGSVNLYTGKIVYQYFNYNVDSLTALIFVGVFGLSTRELDSSSLLPPCSSSSMS